MKSPKAEVQSRSEPTKRKIQVKFRSLKFKITPYKNKNPKSKAEDEALQKKIEVESTKKFQRPDQRKPKAEVENKENLQKKEFQSRSPKLRQSGTYKRKETNVSINVSSKFNKKKIIRSVTFEMGDREPKK